MTLKMKSNLSARKPISTPEIVKVIMKAGPASTCKKVIILHPGTSKH